eukprot:10553131-Ditylum_brightwellii.AAC.1
MLIYEAKQHGPACDKDNKQVGSYIISLLTGTPVETSTKSYHSSQDGRGMITALQINYLGKSQKELIVNCARKVKDNAFYKSQGAYTFSKFATDLEEAFTTLGDYEGPITENEKLRLLHEKTKTDNESFNASLIEILFCPNIKTFLT